MKKFKEFLWLLIPFLVLGIVGIVSLAVYISAGNLLQSQPSVFVGVVNYISLFGTDKVAIRAILNTFLPGMVASVIALGIFTVICRLVSKKREISKKFYYIVSTLVGTVAAFFTNVAIHAFDVAVTDNGYAMEWSFKAMLRNLDIFNAIFSIQLAIIAVFLFWIIETIVGAIKRKNKVME